MQLQCHAVCRSLFRFVCSMEEDAAFIRSVYSEKGARERERDERTMGEKCTVGCNGSVARHYNYVRSAVLICCNNDTIEKVSQ